MVGKVKLWQQDYDNVMRPVPFGKLLTAGIFVSIAARRIFRWLTKLGGEEG